MVLPLSPIVGDIFMKAFERVALDSSSYKPKMWFRYVDDTFIIWTHEHWKFKITILFRFYMSLSNDQMVG